MDGFRLRRNMHTRQEGLLMNDSYASDTLKDVIWPEFLAHFKSETTKALTRQI